MYVGKHAYVAYIYIYSYRRVGRQVGRHAGMDAHQQTTHMHT